MNKVLLALLATSTLAIAAPALAHEGDDWDDDGGGVPTYELFQQQSHHIWDGIQHGLSDGSYTPAQASRFYRELRQIQARAEWDSRRGYYNPQWTEAQLTRLHDRMHAAHERGHERLDSGWGRDGYYGYAPDNGYYGYYGRR